MDSFEEIEAKRVRAGLTRKQVYERAGLHKETWRRTNAGKTSPNVKTLEKLNSAIAELAEEKGSAHV